jgi:hypothetical protein
MIGFSRLIVSAAFGACAVIMAGAPSEAARRIVPHRGIGAYDGDWSVLVQTTRGNCPPALRAGVVIRGGRVLADDPGYQLNGEVAPGGAVRVTVSAGGQSADGFGRLSRASGAGSWRTPSGQCAGRWTAARRE